MNASKVTTKYKKGGYLLAFFLFPAILCFVYYYFVVRKPLVSGNDSVFVKLAYFGPKQLGPNGKDTIYHSIPDFAFVNQEGKVITQKHYEGKMYVADFLSCSDRTVSIKLAAQYFNIQKKLSFINNFLLLSHTVNPKEDTLSVLKQYAYEVHAIDNMWNVVTGDKKQLYTIATNGYLVDVGDFDNFTFSKTLVLVDKERHIRGFYDGTSVTDVNRLQDEVRVLFAEYRMKARNKKQHIQ